MRVRKITLEQALESERKEYNESVWRSTVKRYAGYDECEFYEDVAEGRYGDKEVYAVYIMMDGVRTMQTVSYSSCLSSGSFAEYSILPTAAKGVYDIARVTEKGLGYPNNPRIRKGLAEISKVQKESFFTIHGF